MRRDPAAGDHLSGGPGNDKFYADDGQRDLIYCGRQDYVEADKGRDGPRDSIDDSCEGAN